MATLCVSDTVSEVLHAMLLPLNAVKGDPGKLVARILKLPKMEPWGRLLPKNPGLPQILKGITTSLNITLP